MKTSCRRYLLAALSFAWMPLFSFPASAESRPAAFEAENNHQTRYHLLHDGWWPYFEALSHVIWYREDWELDSAQSGLVQYHGQTKNGDALRFALIDDRIYSAKTVEEWIERGNAARELSAKLGSDIALVTTSVCDISGSFGIQQEVLLKGRGSYALVCWLRKRGQEEVLGVVLERVSPGPLPAEFRALFREISMRIIRTPLGPEAEPLFPYIIYDLPNMTRMGQASGILMLRYGDRLLPYLEAALHGPDRSQALSARYWLQQMNSLQAKFVLRHAPKEAVVRRAMDERGKNEIQHALRDFSSDKKATESSKVISQHGFPGLLYVYSIAYEKASPPLREFAARWLGTAGFVGQTLDAETLASVQAHRCNSSLNLAMAILARKLPPKEEVRILMKGFTFDRSYSGILAGLGFGVLEECFPDEVHSWLTGEDPELRAVAALARTRYVPLPSGIGPAIAAGLSSKKPLAQFISLHAANRLQHIADDLGPDGVNALKRLLTSTTVLRNPEGSPSETLGSLAARAWNRVQKN